MTAATRPQADPDAAVRQLTDAILAAGENISGPSPAFFDLQLFDRLTGRGLTLAQAVARCGQIIRGNNLTPVLAELNPSNVWDQRAVHVLHLAAAGEDVTRKVNDLAERDGVELTRALGWATWKVSLAWPAPPAAEVEKVRAIVRGANLALLTAEELKEALPSRADRERVRFLLDLAAGEERHWVVTVEEKPGEDRQPEGETTTTTTRDLQPVEVEHLTAIRDVNGEMGITRPELVEHITAARKKSKKKGEEPQTVSGSSVSHVLKPLKEFGYVTKSRSGRYVITAAGLEALTAHEKQANH